MKWINNSWFFLIALLWGCDTQSPDVLVDTIGRTPETVEFSGYTWDVKSGDNQFGPGPNYFTNSYDAIWVDENGYLHMKIVNKEERWWASEVITQKTVGYGTYTWVVEGDLVNIPENIVLGLFTWDNNTFQEQANSEVDIEFAKWGVAETDYTLHTSVQPVNFGPYYPERSYEHQLANPTDLIGVSTHSFTWTDTVVTWYSYKGDKALQENLISTWTFDLDSPARVKNENGLSSDAIVIPAPGNTTNARINFWILNGVQNPPSDQMEQEIIIRSFSYEPL